MKTSVCFQDVSQTLSSGECPGFKNVILNRWVGFPSADFGVGDVGRGGRCIRSCSQGGENPRVCSSFLHAALHFLREACRTLPSRTAPGSLHHREAAAAWPLRWSSGSAAANRAALINLPKCVQTLRGTSSALLFPLCNDLNSSSASSEA